VEAAEGEPVDFDTLPGAVAEALADAAPADRSAAAFVLVKACRAAGFTQGQTVTIANSYPPAVEKYGARVADDVARSWPKAESEGEREERRWSPVWGEKGWEEHKARQAAQQANGTTPRAGGAPQQAQGGTTAGVGTPDDGRIVAPAVCDGTWEEQSPQWQAFENAFWTARPELTHIRDAALARLMSPWSTLGVALARVIAATPSRVRLPANIAGPGSLNLFVALVGGSSDGKGGSTWVGNNAVDLGRLGEALSRDKEHTVCFETYPLGSGQGIAHAYRHYDKLALAAVPHAESAIITIGEIDSLVGLSKQSGSTVMAELRKLAMGEELGHLYVDVHKKVIVPPHTYRASLITGVQPERAGVLLDDEGGGTPQRFVWLLTVYPHSRQAVDDPPADPVPFGWDWQHPTWVPDKHDAPPAPVTPAFAPSLPHKPGEDPASAQPVEVSPRERQWVTLPVAKVASRTIRIAHLGKQWKQRGEALDGHRMLCQLKVAAALGILAGRAEVNEADWELAARVMAVSDRTRAEVVATLQTKAQGRNVAQARFEADRAVVVEDVKEAHAVARVAGSVRRILGQAGDWVSRKELRSKFDSAGRARVDPALEYLIGAGQVVAEEVPGTAQSGTRYRLVEGGSG
jgi:hypothetical protein